MRGALGLCVTVLACALSMARAQSGHDEDQKFKHLEEKKQKYWRDHSDSSGRVRPDLMLKAIDYVEHMQIAAGITPAPRAAKNSAMHAASASSPLLAGGVIGVQWTQVGPAPLSVDSTQSVMGAGPNSGEVVDIAIDPRNSTDQVIYIATNDGGVWKSTDGGSSWKAKMDFLPSLSIGAVALDPTNPSVVYAGSGNPFDGSGRYCCNGSANLKTAGIYKSIDAGETWSVENPITFSQPTGIFTGVQVNRIVVLAGNVVLAATSNGLYRSADGGQNFGSTAPFNNGLPILASGTFISDLKVDTATATTVYAAVSGLGILVSTDGGVTFPTNLFTTGGPPVAKPNTPATGKFLNITMAQSTQPNNQTIYALVASTDNQSPTNGNKQLDGLYKSTDTGGTWSQVLPKNWTYCQCPYDQTVGVDPQDPNRIYIGFVDMFRATDGGVSPASFGIIGDNDIHDDHHAITFSPSGHWSGTPTRIYVGTDGGIATSPTQGDNGTWTNINSGIATNLFFIMDMGRGNATNNGYMYGALQDQGVPDHRPPFAPGEWHLNTGGDGFAVAVEPADGAKAYGRYNSTTIYTSDGGVTWTGQTLTGLPVSSTGTENLVTDPNDGTTVYTTQGNQLFRGSHSGSNIAFTSIATFSVGTSVQVATAQIDSNTLWVGLSNGKVARIDNARGGSPSKTEYTIPGAPALGVGGIAMDPTNTAIVAVVYPGFTGLSPTSSTKHVFLTTNSGTSWTDITGTSGGTQNLPDLPLNSVVIDPGTSPHTIIVASDVAVLRTADTGATWQVLGVGFPTVLGTTLTLDTTPVPSLLRVSTYGRSVFELTAASGPLLAVNANLAFGSECEGQTSTRIVQLFNVGSANLQISSITRVAGSGDFQIISGPATPVTLLPGEEIDYTVQFLPTAAGNEFATFQINSNDQFQPVRQLAASGTGAVPTLMAFTPDLGNYGNVCEGSYKDLAVTLANTGCGSLSVTGIASSSTEFQVPGTAPTLLSPLVIAGGTSVQVPVRFTPTASPVTFGPRSATITISTALPGAPASTPVGVSATVPPPSIRVTGSNTFGDVCAGTQSQQTLTVNNTGMCDLHANVALSAGCVDFKLVNNPFPATVSPDSGLNDVVQFTPTSVGPKTCNWIVTSDDPLNPTVTLPLTADTPYPSIDVPPNQSFVPTVVQSIAACHSPDPFPISNKGTCSTNITNIAIGGTNGDNYGLSGVPSFPIALQAGHVAGDGALNAVFSPLIPLSRNKLGTLTVTYESDPITHAVTSVPRNLCGEAVMTGARVLVKAGGVPLPSVAKIQIQRITGNRNKPIVQTVDVYKNAMLQTVTPAAPCTMFQYHREYGTVSNPIQLAPGSYVVTVQAVVAGKNVSQTVAFDVNSCGFVPTIVVNF